MEKTWKVGKVIKGEMMDFQKPMKHKIQTDTIMSVDVFKIPKIGSKYVHLSTGVNKYQCANTTDL